MNANWLAQLAPEHQPAPPSWWPPAPGWWLAGAACLMALAAIAAWHFWKNSPRRRIRRAAFAELQRIRARRAAKDTAGAIQHLLRRYALTIFGPERVANLTGESWIDFVVQHGGEALAGDQGREFLSAAFGTRPGAPQESWLAAAEDFIRKAPRRGRIGKRHS
jgi:Domain of unknown function (DUF4381)